MREGGLIIAGDGCGADAQRATYMCPHCQEHFLTVKGSGRPRGFCTKCMAPTCGKPDCEARCDPWQKKIDRIEQRAAEKAKREAAGV